MSVKPYENLVSTLQCTYNSCATMMPIIDRAREVLRYPRNVLSRAVKLLLAMRGLISIPVSHEVEYNRKILDELDI